MKYLGNIFLFIVLIILFLFDLKIWDNEVSNFLFWEFRFPRVMGAVITGIGLSFSGLLMQTLFRNPLAGPYLIGISPGATFGMALFIFLSGTFSLSFEISPIWGSTIGAFSALGLQLLINRGFGHTHRLLLTGLVLGFLFSAATELMQYFGSNEQLREFTFWGMGNFERIEMTHLFSMSSPVFFGIILIYSFRNSLDCYLLGDEYAQASGVSPVKIKNLLIWTGAIIAGWLTAYSGPIGFIGLVGPHIAKRLYKTEKHSKILLPTILWGGILAVGADCIAHYSIPGILLPINPISSLIGAPILILSFIRKQK